MSQDNEKKYEPMKAMAFYRYGGPEVFQLIETAVPVIKEDEILVRVLSTSVNSADWRLRKADPWIARLFTGITRPRKQILGVAFSGKVEATGKNVTRFKPGDEIFGSSGFTLGAYAEYMCIKETAVIAGKPEHISHLEAATIPFGGSTALYFLRKAKIRAGDTVMIYGASGAVGSAAIQVAKYFGAEVTGICSSGNFQLVRSLGADHLMDYTKAEFLNLSLKYDVIFETVGKLPYSSCLRLLKKDGVLLMGAAGPGQMLMGVFTSIGSKRRVISGVVTEKPADMIALKEMVESGNYKPVVDRVYPLREMAEAHRYVELGHKIGNVGITMQ